MNLNSMKIVWLLFVITSIGLFDGYAVTGKNVEDTDLAETVQIYNGNSSSVNDTIRVTFKELVTLLPKSMGETIFLIKKGVYENLNIILKKSSDKLITIMAEQPGGVIITGNSTITVSDSRKLTVSGFVFKEISARSSIVLSNSSSVELSDNYFVECGTDRFGSIVRIENGSNSNRISYNTFDANKSMGVVIVGSSDKDQRNINNQIYNNFFYNIASVNSLYPGKDGNGLEAIQLGQGRKSVDWEWNTRIYNNLFENIVGDGSEIISVKTSKNFIYSNTFLNNKSGITIRSGANTKVYNNFLDNTSQGIRVFGYGHVIENNYIDGGNFGIQMPASHISSKDNVSEGAFNQQEKVKIKNNVIINPKNAAFIFGQFWSAEKNRVLVPKNITVSYNKIVTDGRSEAFKLENDIIGRQNKIVKNSINTLSGAQLKNSGSANLIDGLINAATKILKFQSKDSRVGARWKKL